MSRFVKPFRERYDGQLSPLLTALDPEIGIGYQEPVNEKNNPLLETLNISLRISEDDSIACTKVHSLLLQKWHELDDEREQAIVLQSADFENIHVKNDFPILGMSVLFRQAGEKVIIESAGGINTPALMGRFTIGRLDIAAAELKLLVFELRFLTAVT